MFHVLSPPRPPPPPPPPLSPPPVIKLYILSDVREEELQAVLSFLAAASDSSVQEELLQLLFGLLTTSSPHGLAETLWNKGLPLLVLIRAESMAVRLLTIKVLLNAQTQSV